MPVTQNSNPSYLLSGILAAGILLNFSALLTPILGIDGPMYASIAKTMALNNNYRDLLHQGSDWLDKPHFPFWMAAFSFELFGFESWAYKLPAVIFSMMAVWYTYLFAKSLYNKEIALWAAVILLTAEYFNISNIDVRAEAYLTGLVIGSLYHFYRSLENKNWHLLIGALFLGCAIMTKGIYIIVPVAGAVMTHLVAKKQWKQLFHWRWIAAGILTFIFILPELVCLYYQFDVHPEKLMFGRHNVSGLKFFFWDSQFGRFFNTGPIIRDESNPFFYFHTLLWTFIPWCLLLYIAVIHFFRNASKLLPNREWFCIGGSVLTFLFFSISGFQLPYYLNIIFPLSAILVAQYLYNVEKLLIVMVIQATTIVSMVLFCIWLYSYYRPEKEFFSVGILATLIITTWVFIRSGNTKKDKIVLSSAAAAIATNLFLGLIFYPSVGKYQSGSEAAIWINKNNKDSLPVAHGPDVSASSLEFYSHQQVSVSDSNGNVPLSSPYLMFASKEWMQILKERGQVFTVVQTFPYYNLERYTVRFLDHRTRESTLMFDYLLRIE